MAKASRRPQVMLVGTGGTIASTGLDTTDYHNYMVSSTVAEILAAVPELDQLADIATDQPVNVDSQKIDNDDLLKIARSVATAVADPKIDAVIVTHGTDTLEETAFFLHLSIRSAKPIIMVGAMRPSGSLSADGPLNLYNAMVLATSDAAKGKGVLFVANNHVYGARDLVKRDTAGIDAIEAAKYGILAEISGTDVLFTHVPARPHTMDSEFDLAAITQLPEVDIMFDHQSAGRHLYAASIAAGVKGIVVAGMGNGSLSKAARHGAMLAHQAGIPFIRSSRTGQGIVSPHIDDAEFDILTAGSLTPQKARILAILAIASGNDHRQLQSVFNRY